MLATCITTLASDFGPPWEVDFLHENLVYDTFTTGEAYEVYGVGVRRGVVLLLMENDFREAEWGPAGMFTIDETAPIPRDWRLNIVDRKAAVGASSNIFWGFVMGYEQLAVDPDHIDRLLNGEDADEDVFYQQVIARRRLREEGAV